VYRDGPQAPGRSNRSRSSIGQGAVDKGHSESSLQAEGVDPSTLVRNRVQAIVTRHGLSALVGRRPETAPAMPPCDEAAVALLADLAIAGNGPALSSMFSVYAAAGWSHTVLLLDLLTPAIRLIGRYWEEDRCDFATVSSASALMQRSIHAIMDGERRPAPLGARTALIAVTPGDQHGLGAMVISELLRAAGWSVQTRLDAGIDALVAEARAVRYDVVGFSLSRTSRLDMLKETIGQIRLMCPGPVRILVGGRVFAAGEAQAADVGADAAAVDGPEMIGLLDDAATIVAAD
jgi:methanogenic corrinoid protein MtbC1